MGIRKQPRKKAKKYGSFHVGSYRVELVKMPAEMNPSVRIMDGRTEVGSYSLTDLLKEGFVEVVAAHIPGLNGALLVRRVTSLAKSRRLLLGYPKFKPPRSV